MGRRKQDAQSPEVAQRGGKGRRARTAAPSHGIEETRQLPFEPDSAREPEAEPAPSSDGPPPIEPRPRATFEAASDEEEADVPSPSATALVALHDGFTAVVLRVVGRLGAKAARAASTRLRELLTRWAAARPAPLRELCLGYVLAVGPALTRAERSRDGIELNLRSFGPIADAALGVSGGRMARDAMVELGVVLVRGLVDDGDARGPDRILEELRAELRGVVDRPA